MLLQWWLKQAPECCVLVLADDMDVDHLLALYTLGVSNCRNWSDLPSDNLLRSTLTTCVLGDIGIGQSALAAAVRELVARRAAENTRVAPTRTPAHHLMTTHGFTRRECEVFALLEEGYSDKEIAAKLDREVGTIASHVKSIRAKLDVHSRSAAVSKVRRWGSGQLGM